MTAGLKVSVGILMGGTGAVGAAAAWTVAQATPVISDNALVPISFAVGVLVAAVTATFRITRWLERNRTRLEEVEERLDALEGKGGP